MSDTPQVLLAHHLKALKLPTFLREYDKLARQCAAEGVDYPRFLLRLAEQELIDRDRRMVERRIKAAKFPTLKSLDSFDFVALPSLNKALVMELARCEYIERHENVTALGNSGTGKSHIALGLGLAACQKGLSVGFTAAAAIVRLWPGGRLGLAPKSLARAKERLRGLTRRNRGIALERMIEEVNRFVIGWATYFRHAACKKALAELDEWLRRKLRCVRLKQLKRAKPTVAFLVKHGVPVWRAVQFAASGKGWWRRSGSPPAHEAMTIAWFDKLGLVSLSARYAALQSAGNRRVR